MTVFVVRFPDPVTFPKDTWTGANVLTSPISNVLDVAPVGMNFCKLPTTWPLVLVTDPVELITTLFAPVVIFPLVKVSVPFTVTSVLMETPGKSLMVNPTNDVEAVPEITSAAVDAGPKSTVFGLVIESDPVELFVQLPMSVNVPLAMDFAPLPDNSKLPYVGERETACTALDPLLY